MTDAQEERTSPLLPCPRMQLACFERVRAEPEKLSTLLVGVLETNICSG